MAGPHSYAAGVRLLPNAVTVLALCSGLSAVYFALSGQFQMSVGAVGVAALCDGLDGRLARMLDATSRLGAELDSLADLVSFGVSPALVLYLWGLSDTRFGWIVTLVFAVCMALRLARFNTLLDVADRYPFSKEFFVGVPAPAAALSAGIPLYLTIHFGPGWWSEPVPVGLWALLIAALMVSRLPTLSVKAIRVPASFIAPLLVVVGVGVAVLITVPFLGLAVVATGYLAVIPYTCYRYRWLARHPEAWDVPMRERRALARAARANRRLGLRPPLRRSVAGWRARAMARAVRRFGDDRTNGVSRPPQTRSPEGTNGVHRSGQNQGGSLQSGPGPGPAPRPVKPLRLGPRRRHR